MFLIDTARRWFFSNDAQFGSSIVRWIIRGLVLLMPAFFIPAGNFPQEMNKTILFTVTVLIASFFCLYYWVQKRELRLYYHRSIWLVIASYVCILISTILSKNFFSSIFGSGGSYSGNAVTAFCYILFFFLLIGTTRDIQDWRWLAGSLSVVVTFGLGVSVLQNYGLYLLPWGMAQDIRFNIFASSSITASIVATLVIFVTLILFWQSKGLYRKLWWIFCLTVQILYIMASGKTMVIFIGLAGLALFSAAGLARIKSFNKWEALVPLVACIALATGMAINFPQLTHASSSTTLTLDQRTSMSIAYRSIKQSLVLGTGPQTFAYDFQRWRPASFNQTSNASVRFNKSGSEWWGQLTQIGTIFVLLQLALMGWLVIKAIIKFLNDWKSGNSQWSWSLGVLVFFLALLAVFFMTPFNFILYFLWWLWLGINFRFLSPSSFIEKVKVFRPFQFTWFVMLLCISSILVLVGVSGYAGVRFWLADYKSYRANELINTQAPLKSIENLLQDAVKLNSHEAGYVMTLAQGYATAAQLEASRTTPDPVIIQGYVQKTVDALKQARVADPENAIVYEQTALLYDSMRNLISNADPLAEEAYKKQSELEPTNPQAFLNIGRAILVQAQAGAQSSEEGIKKQSTLDLVEAINYFRKSKSLQPSNYLADVNIAFALQAQGDLAGAKASLEEALRIKPGDTTIEQLLSSLNKTTNPDKE